MEELFNTLEKRIHSFVQKLHELQRLNASLKCNHAELYARHKNAAEQIEEMVARLKQIEGLS